MKFRIDELGYFDGFDDRGQVPMTAEYNLNNLPTYYHKWVGDTWVLDSDKLRSDEIDSELKELYTKKAEVLTRIDYNENWYGPNHEHYQLHKDIYESQKISIQGNIEKLHLELKGLGG